MNATIAKSIIEENRVACLTTNSLRKILEFFVGDKGEYLYFITKLKANASNIESTQPTIIDKMYGFEGYFGRKIDTFNMDYRIKFDKDGLPTNPIDENGRAIIEGALDRLSLEDASVDTVNVLIRDPKIGELSGINEELFHLTLVSDPIDSDIDKEKVKEHPINETLVKYNKFKYRIMHARQLIDRKQELTVPRTKRRYIILWLGKTIYSLNSPIKVAQHLKEAHFGEFKLLKRYGVDQEERLVLLGVSR